MSAELQARLDATLGVLRGAARRAEREGKSPVKPWENALFDGELTHKKLGFFMDFNFTNQHGDFMGFIASLS